MEGRSLSQHLFRSIVCKRVVDASRGRPFDGFGAAVAPEPVVPIDLSDEDDSQFAAPIEYDEELLINVGSHAESDLAENGESLEESNLLEVVTFPTAFTNSAHHGVETSQALTPPRCP